MSFALTQKALLTLHFRTEIFFSTVNIVNGAEVVAKREFLINPKGSRCICLWTCSCFCFESFLTTEVYDICHDMPPKNEIYAGFFDEKNCEELESEIDGSISLKKYLLMASSALLSLLLFLGKFN